jgi:hypothetical protein
MAGPSKERRTALRRGALALVALSLCTTGGCDDKTKSAATPTAEPKPAAALPADAGMGTWRFPEATRVIAIGDVHGDLKATRTALRIAGLIDDDDTWTGGETVLVQTGDMLDRGDDEQAIVDLLLRLKKQAAEAGGTVHILNGNHELMNAAGDFRYVTPGGFSDFEGVPGLNMDMPVLDRVPEKMRARAAAWLPGGVYAKKVAKHPVAVIVGDTVFAHGGVTPNYARDIERINREVTQWLLGEAAAGARIVKSPDSPVWSRHFSDEPDAADCKLLDESLMVLSAKRMVVGHTVQPRIRPACNDKVWRVDVGMAAHYGGHPEVLEIRSGTVKALSSGSK